MFWASLAVALVIAGVAAYPVNRWLLTRGKGHAAVHETGIHGGPSPRAVGAVAAVAGVLGTIVSCARRSGESRRRSRWFAVLALAGCGGDDDDEASVAAPACRQPLRAGDVGDHDAARNSARRTSRIGFANGQIVKSRATTATSTSSRPSWTGPASRDPGDIGTWATTSPGGAEAIYSIDDLAKDHTSWRDGTAIAGLSLDDDGAEESRECVARASSRPRRRSTPRPAAAARRGSRFDLTPLTIAPCIPSATSCVNSTLTSSNPAAFRPSSYSLFESAPAMQPQ